MSQLAFLCDLYNPGLLLFSLVIAFLQLKHKRFFCAVRLFISAILVYGLMFLDNELKLWPQFGLDYSTHTATALALCIYIGVELKRNLINIGLGLSLLGYGKIMNILGYHSWLDIITTAIIITLMLTPLYLINRSVKTSPSKSPALP